MKRIFAVSLFLFLAIAGVARADDRPTLVVTASNEAANRLLVYDGAGALVQTLPTGGQGGVGGNAGGIAVLDGTIAVVNVASSSVSIFARETDGIVLEQVIAVASAPVSVALSKDHL